MSLDKQKFTLLDGGMGRELERIGAPFRQPEWSALALMEKPDSVLQAHKNFIEAGADVITTNSYAVVPFHIGQDAFHASGAELIALSAKIAKQAANESERNIQIAGCIPPFFGSYSPESFQADEAIDLIKPFIQEQQDYVDFWLVETLSSLREAECLYPLLQGTNKPIWLAFTLYDHKETDQDILQPKLRSGEELETVLNDLLMDIRPDALLYNCSQPEEMHSAIEVTRSITSSIPCGAYANSFVRIRKRDGSDALNLSEIRTDVTPFAYLDFVQGWFSEGAEIIGGCCGIGPEHISEIAQWRSRL